MNAKEIEKYLAELGNELTLLNIQEPVRVLLIGGAFISTQIKKRRTTQDIDVVPLDTQSPNTPQIAISLWQATQTISARNRLPDDWFNTLVSDFIEALGPAPIESLWKKFGPLEIYLPPKTYIFTLKIMAHRPKDIADIQTLCKELQIRTREQAQTLIDYYIPEAEIQYLLSIPQTLDNFFPQK